MSTAYVLLLCGLAGSGKSSLARVLKESNDNTSSSFDRIVHIEYDTVARDIQAEQTTSTTATNDDQVFNEESLEAWRSSRRVALEKLDQELENHFATSSNDSTSLLIIMDDNFHLRSMRKNVWHICQAHANERLYFCILWLDVSVETCLKRNRQRSNHNRVPDATIRNMACEPPDPKKATWEQGWIHCKDANDISLELVVVQSQLVVPPPAPVDPAILEQERRMTRESLLHTYDGYLRAWVGAVARIRRSDAGKANEARKDILQRLRKEQGIVDSTSLVMEWFLEQVDVSDWTKEETAHLKTAMQSVLEQ